MASHDLSCPRIVLVIFNIIFFAFGLALLGIGIYARIQSTSVDDYLRVIDRSNNIFENFGSICIVVGVFCTLLGFTGLYGACKESKGCLIIFLILVFVVFILELVAGGLAYGFHNKIEDSVREGMQRTLLLYDGTSDLSKSWDNIQKTLQCCGVQNFTDWENNTLIGNSSVMVPSSCICTLAGGCGSVLLNGTFMQGCFSQVDEEVLKNWKVWGGAAIGFAVVELIGIIFGLISLREVHKSSQYHVA